MRYIQRLIFYKQFLFCSMQGKRTKQSQGPLIAETSKLGGQFHLKAKPQFLETRLKMFSQIKKKIDLIFEAAEKPQITVTLKDGKEIKGKAFFTTPYIIAKEISRNLADSVIVAKVKYTKRYDSPVKSEITSAEVEEEGQQVNEIQKQYELIDLTRPLEGDCELQLITFDQKEGKQVFWHSSAHLLGQSLQNNYGAWLCHGPALDNGFFYDSFMGDYRISQTDYQKVQKQIKKYAQQKQPYERILLTKKQALQMFSYNPFKTQLIQAKIPEDGLTSAYRCGNLIDLCTGPHIPSADRVKGFKVTKNSSAYWLGKKQNDDLQRVYAISFPKQAQLDEYVKNQEQLAKRDHRNIGPKQGLFNFTTLSAGCALFYPHGTIIYNRLVQLMRSQYQIRGYSEVISPNIYSSQLWKISGHYFKYKENIYFINIDQDQYGLKPMNCPGHCVMFDLVQRSYRDLPIRMADFGVLHRNELHGALSGLTRVRRFQQDDAHIFCMPEQLQEEILGVLDLLDYIYSVFDFKYVLQFSTRPQKYLGSLEDWNLAEEQLSAALKKFGKQYKINPGDGAFYGPKIDIKLFDVFGREHQCGTVQLDFQLPQRFNLQFRSKEVKKQEEQSKPEGQQGQEKKTQQKEKKQKKKKQKVEITQEQKQARRKQKQQKKKKQNPTQSVEQKKEQKQEQKQEQVKNIQIEQPKVQKPKEDLASMEERYKQIGHLKNGFVRPVIIHRAIFGSLERFIAILCQHTGGKWPFWVSPRQLQIIPMSNEAKQFAEQVKNTFTLKGYAVHVDNSGDQFNKKIRNAQLEAYNYIGVIGAEQVKQNSITIRERDNQKPIGKFSIPELLKLFEGLKPIKSKRRLMMEENSVKLD